MQDTVRNSVGHRRKGSIQKSIRNYNEMGDLKKETGWRKDERTTLYRLTVSSTS